MDYVLEKKTMAGKLSAILSDEFHVYDELEIRKSLANSFWIGNNSICTQTFCYGRKIIFLNKVISLIRLFPLK